MRSGCDGRREPADHGLVRRGIFATAARVALAGGLMVVCGHGVTGHSVGHFPSFYPDEIRVDVVEPAAAGHALVDTTLHAYVGAAPSFAGAVPGHVKPVASLEAFLILSRNAASARPASTADRCATARGVLAMFGETAAAGFVFHPHPVMPYHADYLHHLDRIESAKGRVGAAPRVPLAVGAKGSLAESIVQARFGRVADDAEFILEAVSIDDLLAAAGAQPGGFSGPPWLKEGWFHAHRLLAPGFDNASQAAVDDDFLRLIRGEVSGLAERINLERRLVAGLTKGCERQVVGYALRQDYINDSYPAGIENVAYDTFSGLNSAIFPRTVKLKEYPWNGKLQLGVRDRSEAAWNPVGGFTDPMGRLIWSAVGDPAMLPIPFNASWMPNRVQSEVTRVQGQSGGIKVPANALRPRPGSGALERVGDWTFASAKVVYEVLASPFEDGTGMAVADLLYPYAFAYRWGAKANHGGHAHEPRLAAVLSALQERLVGIEVVRVDTANHAVAEGLTIETRTPVLEVYLRDTPGDERQLAALAPPWSSVPWHLLALMEEAVIRGTAAFSRDEAVRRRVPWLDLVRDPALGAKLRDLMAQFERDSYRPAPLMDLVTADEARARWRALRAFAEKNGHLLVTNGPYRLKQWTPSSVALEAVRELTYPLGFGTFDRFVHPPRAVIGAVRQEAGEITVRADAEMILKMGRDYRLVKEPLLRTTARGVQSLLVVSRYLLIDPDGQVIEVDKMQWREDGHFTIELPQRLPPGPYTIVLGIFLDGNAVQAPAKLLHFRVGATGVPE